MAGRSIWEASAQDEIDLGCTGYDEYYYVDWFCDEQAFVFNFWNPDDVSSIVFPTVGLPDPAVGSLFSYEDCEGECDQREPSHRNRTAHRHHAVVASPRAG